MFGESLAKATVTLMQGQRARWPFVVVTNQQFTQPLHADRVVGRQFGIEETILAERLPQAMHQIRGVRVTITITAVLIALHQQPGLLPKLFRPCPRFVILGGHFAAQLIGVIQRQLQRVIRRCGGTIALSSLRPQSAFQSENESVELSGVVVLRLERTRVAVSNCQRLGRQRPDTSSRDNLLVPSDKCVDERALANAGTTEKART